MAGVEHKSEGGARMLPDVAQPNFPNF
jgi:hypothetical protein